MSSSPSATFDPLHAARSEARRQSHVPLLYRLLATYNTDWDAVRERLRSHPSEAVARPAAAPPAAGGGTNIIATGSTGRGGASCAEYLYVAADGRPLPVLLPFLHEVLSRRDAPPDVIRSAIEADPESLTVPAGPDRNSPLHFACKFRRPVEVVRTVLDARPEAATLENRTRRLPLHGAVQPRSVLRPTERSEVVGMLLEAHPEAVLRHDLHDDSPLCLFVQSTAPNHHDFWEVLEQLLRARHRFLHSCAPEFRPLHAYFESYYWFYPPDVAEGLCRRFPDDASRKDEGGKMPLHVCLSTYLEYLRSERIRDRRTSPALVGRCVRALLELYPPVAGVPAEGAGGRSLLPLHLAVECGLPWEVLELVMREEPRALETGGGTTGLLPFMAAAVGESASVDTVYRLLRESPTMAWQPTGVVAIASGGLDSGSAPARAGNV